MIHIIYTRYTRSTRYTRYTRYKRYKRYTHYTIYTTSFIFSSTQNSINYKKKQFDQSISKLHFKKPTNFCIPHKFFVDIHVQVLFYSLVQMQQTNLNLW